MKSFHDTGDSLCKINSMMMSQCFYECIFFITYINVFNFNLHITYTLWNQMDPKLTHK